MMKRLLSAIILLSCAGLASWADETHEVILDKAAPKVKTFDLGFANVSFSLIKYKDSYRTDVTIVNIQNEEAIVLFKNDQNEEALKDRKDPKVKFSKNYPGDNRNVKGIKELYRAVVPIIPMDSAKFQVDLSPNSDNTLELPFYFSRVDLKKALDKGPYNIKYELIHTVTDAFDIKLTGWDENNPEYVSTKAAVDEYIKSLSGLSFCNNKNHKPSLRAQQKPYVEKKDSLEKLINGILDAHSWMSMDEPYKKYEKLLNQVEAVNLNEYAEDCGIHKKVDKPIRDNRGNGQTVRPPKERGSVSAVSIYKQMQDTYIALRAGKMSKSAAVSKARSLMNTYQRSGSKDATYSGKISQFYNRILNQ